MTDFNSYMGNIDTDFFRELCLRNGELRYYKRNEFILREGEVGSFFGFIVSGVIKYTCINQTENKTYNVGFSFANEFISDYPNCLYDIKSELNIQAITPCRIYICSSELLLQEFEENKENQRIARIAAEQLFFSRIHVTWICSDLHRKNAISNFLKMSRNPTMVPLKEIASYLKITPIHMSRIRHKQSFDSKE